MNKAREKKSVRAKVPSFNWRDKATYEDLLVSEYLAKLEIAWRQYGEAPENLQLKVAGELQAYFSTDARERAPTMIVNDAMAQRFHDVLRQIMRFVNCTAVASLDPSLVSAEVKHALLSYKDIKACSPVAIDAYDHDQGLVRLSYYVHGTKPREEFFVDGRVTPLAFGKYRACNFFRRMLFWQRIVWLPAEDADALSVYLDGRLVSISLDPKNLLDDVRPVAESHESSMAEIRRAFPRSKGKVKPLTWDVGGIKARLMIWLAKLPWIRQKFACAWVFMDRDIDADDSAEHLYRWVRKHHPEVNAWFLLARNSPDFARLSAEGFRIVEPGILRKLMLLNSELILSSHPDYVFGGFDLDLYGRSMNWRFVFLQHGVTKDDMSHWLSNKPFDLFVTSSPKEHASIVENDTPYTYTEREMCRCGLPRHDGLLAAADLVSQEEINILLVMPTWRGSLADKRSGEDVFQTFVESEYAKRWSALLHSDRLLELIRREGMRLVFMPHPNAVPFLAAFELPSHVEVMTKADIGMQQLFARTALMVTDFSSVAFEMAYLRRPVIYYHYDFVEFYAGNHNWRQGYYDYSTNGFGPRAYELDQIVEQVELFMDDRRAFTATYLPRMLEALPERDGKACERLFQRIMERFASWRLLA